MRVRKRRDDLEKKPIEKWEIGIVPVDRAEETGGGIDGKVSEAGGPLVSSTCIGDWNKKWEVAYV